MNKPIIPKGAALITNEMVKSVIPENLPPLKWNASFISRMVHLGRLQDMDRAASFQASIAEQQLKNVRAKCQMIEEMVTLSSRLQTSLEKSEYQRDMMKHMKEKAELKNMLLRFEIEQARIDTRLRQKEAEAILNESTEDRY